MFVLVNLVTYSAAALLVLWVIGECRATPTSKILARWKKMPPPRVRAKAVVLPLVVAPLPEGVAQLPLGKSRVTPSSLVPSR
jgi:hypothetical protein